MVDSNYILDSLKSLDDYSTTIESLSDKLCTKICNDYGINRTTELEEKVNRLLSRYRYGLVSGNDVISNIDSIVKESASNTENTNSNTVNNTSESSKASPENISNNSNNMPNEVNTDDKTNTETIEDTNTNTEKDKKNNESQETIKDDSNSNSNIQKNVPKTIAGVGSIINSEFDDSDDMVDVIPDAVMDSASQYSDVESSLSGAEITVPSIVSGECGALITAANKAKEEIASTLQDILTSITDILKTIYAADDRVSLMSDELENKDINSFEELEKTASEIKENIKFYYHYPGDVKEVKEMSKEKLSEYFEKNGAKRNGDVYTFTLDGKEYSYNISTYQMSVEPDNKTKKKEDMFARFYMRDDATYEDITNTITILAGQGALDSNSGPFVEGKERLDEGVNAQKSSLIIIPYGHGDGTQGSKSSNKAAMATRIGNFMVGGTNRQITNSIVGYSLGGNAAYEAIAQEENKGLYKICVPVNTFMDKYFGKTEGDSINNMIGTKIIQLEARSDKFRTGSRNARKKLLKGGFPVEDLVLYTNENDEYKYSEKVLGDNYIYLGDINKKITIDGKSQINPNYDPAWVTHFHGIEMIKTSGILTYLGEF